MKKKIIPKPKEKVAPAKRWFTRTAFLISVAALLVLLGGATVYAFYYNHRYLPRTYVAGVSIGGLNKELAKAQLASRVQAFQQTPIAFTSEGRSWQLTPAELGSSIDIDQALTESWTRDQQGTWLTQLKNLFMAPFVTRYLEPGFISVSQDGEVVLQTKVLGSIETPHRETGLDLTPGRVAIVEGKAGIRIERTALEADMYRAFKYGNSEVEVKLQPFQPEITVAMAEPARAQASALLAKDWQISLGSAGKLTLHSTELTRLLDVAVARDPANLATGLKLTFKKNFLDEQLAAWASSIKQDPLNAGLTWKDGALSVSDPAKEGRALDVEASRVALSQILLDTTTYTFALALPINVVQPEVRADTLSSLGIKELIGSAATDYTGSPANRKTNIGVGQRKLNRLLLTNNGIFSTTGTLGEVDASTGYLPELVIKGNRTTPEYGGGLCQVSTTLFRAVLNAGLPITERQNHAYRVSYYERGVGPGLDATVYIPSPDLKWKNDTGSAVYIQSRIEKNAITFDIFGTKDGRVATISPPTVLETYPVGAPIYANSDTLLIGQTKQVETAHDGAKTSVSYSVTRNGQSIYKKTFISVYRAWPAQYLVGTKPAPEPTPTPTPTPTP